jgi:hypothetical protein
MAPKPAYQDSSITSVIESGSAKLYRFFCAVRAHSFHGLPPPGPQVLRPTLAGHALDSLADELHPLASGHTLLDPSQLGGLLLPLRHVESTQRMRQAVRDAEVRFALVGDILRTSSANGAVR